MNPGDASIAEMRATLNQEFDVVLVPVSDPALGVIRVSESLFAIGSDHQLVGDARFLDRPAGKSDVAWVVLDQQNYLG